MNLELDLTVRMAVPDPRDFSLQSFYIFNIYRAGSSVVEAAAEALAHTTNRTPLNVTRTLYDLGIEYFDNQNYRKSCIYLAHAGATLTKLCSVGGYVNYGFREIPFGFGERFQHLAASIVIVRDLRDIGISQYRAVAQHTSEGRVLGEHILDLRQVVGRQSLAEFLLSKDTVSFLHRIALCYASIARRGGTIIKYEDLSDENGFSTRALCAELHSRFSPFAQEGWMF